MTVRFPSVDAYLARLPEGIDSYPSVCAKGAIVAAAFKDAPDPLRLGEGLPPAIEALLREPPLPGDWVAEVKLIAILCAIYDRSFAGRGGMPALHEWVYGRNRRLLSGPIYRILFAVLSPERLFVGAAHRWSAFRCGSTVEVVNVTRGEASLRLLTSPHILPDVGQILLTAALRAAFELSGAKAPSVIARAESPSVLRVDASWA